MKAICPMCRQEVEFDEPKSILSDPVPEAIEHLVPQIVMGSCGHTVAPRWLNKPDEYVAEAKQYVAQVNRRVLATATA